VPTHFAPYGRAIGELAGHPAVPYFELLQRVLSLWKAAPGVRLVYKDFIVANDRSRVMPRFIREEVPDAIVTTQRLTDVMWAIDAIVVDHVITAAPQVLLANKPTVFFMPATTPQADRARVLLRSRASVATTPDEFVEQVRQLLESGTYPPVQDTDRAFLKRYGVHRGDGRSARRAADVIRSRGA
jgi:hypothetical protein